MGDPRQSGQRARNRDRVRVDRVPAADRAPTRATTGIAASATGREGEVERIEDRDVRQRRGIAVGREVDEQCHDDERAATTTPTPSRT
jgi:hypothetical protein